jgi:hypothetical protein
MALLPNAKRAEITFEKLAVYLMDINHPKNGGKAGAFEALGYHKENWERLAEDLREQHLNQDAIVVETNPFGVKYAIIAVLHGPTGSDNIKSMWQIDHDKDYPRFITAYPA